MSGSLNKVILIGNVGKDPEIRSFQNGNRVASFSVATSQSWKDKETGERKDRTEWHNISVLNEAIVGVVEKYVVKGMKIYVEGALETRKWQDKSGADRYSTEIVLRQFNGQLLMLSKSREDDKNNGVQNHQNEANSAPKKQQGGFGFCAADPPSTGDIDDEIPF